MKDRTTWTDWNDVERTNPVAAKMALARDVLAAVMTGGLRAALISGPPGIGKNETVAKACRDAGAMPIRANPSTYLDLVAKLAEGKRVGRPVWLDEADVIFRSDRMLNTLKVATSDVARDRIYNGRDIGCPVIVTTNTPLGVDSNWRPELRDHIAALFSRSPPVAIHGSRLELWEFSVFVGQTSTLLRQDDDGDGIPLATANAALDWFTRHVYRLENVSPRSLRQIALIMTQRAKGRINAAVADSMLNNMIARDRGERPPLSPVIIPPKNRGIVAQAA